MYYLKNKHFYRWARKHGVTDTVLSNAITEFEKGLYEANLGNCLYKKRIALAGKGKSGGARTILFYQQGKKLIFCFGFEKNEQDSLTHTQHKILNQLSDLYHHMPEEEVISMVKNNKFFEIVKMEE